MTETHRRRACALALFIAPGATLAGHLTQLTPTEHDTASELASLADAPGRAGLATLFGFIALVLAVPAFLGLARPLWAARPRLAAVGVSMSVAGAFGLTALIGSSPLMIALARSAADRDVAVAVADAYESDPLVAVWVSLMLIGYSLGPIVLGIGLWRCGWSWAVPAALVLGLVLMMADAGRWPLAAGFAATWAGLALAGARLWREDGEPMVSAPRQPARVGDGLP
jgi:hypothetical protein